MRYHSIIICIFLFLLTSASASDELVRCKGEYKYAFSLSTSITEAKERSKQMAVMEALGEKFGLEITMQAFLEMGTNQPERFSQYAQTLVRGQWVSNRKEPSVQCHEQDNLLWVTVQLDFNGRPKKKNAIEFDYKLLRNGTEDRFDSKGTFYGSRYENMADRFYLSFKSPKEGYIAVFWEEPGKVMRLLPNRGEDNEATHVLQGHKHLFFNTNGNEFYITCKEEETNMVHIIFCPENFIERDVPEEMTNGEYKRWLTRMNMLHKDLQIKPEIVKVLPK